MPLRVHVQASPSKDGSARPWTTLLRKAARETLREARVRDAEISLTLVDDAGIARLHRQWLKKNGPTDVLSFPLYEPGEPPVGDVYIGIEQARRQAERLGIPLRQELARLAVHGTLHVLGHDHPEGAGRETSPMWRLQERILTKVLQA